MKTKMMSRETLAGSSASLSIRSFQDTDELNAKEIYRSRMMEHVMTVYTYILASNLFWGISLVAMAVAYVCLSVSFLVLTLLVLLVTPYVITIHAFKQGIAERLRGDLHDIRALYIDKPRNHMWVAECGGRVVGTVCVREDSRDPTKAELFTLSVARHYRNLGIAGKLIDTAIEFCREQSYTELCLSTAGFMISANRLYRRMGFQLQRTRHRYVVMFKCTAYDYSMNLAGRSACGN